MLIFIFSMIGLFTVIFVAIPSQFFQYQVDLQSTIGVDPEVAEYFDVWNITMYDNAGQHNMTHPYTSLEDGPAAPDWELQVADQYLEVWWSELPYLADPYRRVLQLRHATYETFLGFPYWSSHPLGLYTMDNVYVSDRIFQPDLATYFNAEQNACAIHARCDHTASNVVLQFNTSKYATIEDAWVGGELHYLLSYEYHWNQTNVNAWTVLAQLLRFRSPDLGIPGLAGTVFNAVIAFPFWIMVAILIIKLVQSMIPLIKGTED